MEILGQTGVLKEWLSSTKVSDFCFTLPYEWNEKKSCFQTKSLKKQKLHMIRIKIAVVYIFFALIQVVTTWSESSRVVAVHSSLFMVSLFVDTGCQATNSSKAKQIVNLFNNLLAYEKNQSKNRSQVDQSFLKSSAIGKSLAVTKHLMNGQTATGFLMPVLYHLDIFRNPCYPLYVGYWLCGQCQNVELGNPSPGTGSFTEISYKAVVSIVSYSNWSFVFSGFCYVLGIELLLHGFCFRAFIAEAGM